MTGSVLALLGASAGGGGGGGGSEFDVVVSPDPLNYSYGGSGYVATATTEITGGLAPYVVDWFLSGSGDAAVTYVSVSACTVQSYNGDTCSLYCAVTDANGDSATSNTINITL